MAVPGRTSHDAQDAAATELPVHSNAGSLRLQLVAVFDKTICCPSQPEASKCLKYPESYEMWSRFESVPSMLTIA